MYYYFLKSYLYYKLQTEFYPNAIYFISKSDLLIIAIKI